MTEKGYLNLRYILLLLFCVLRLSLVWRHLQSYLDMAHERIEKMKKETGRITNVELQRKVARVFYYLSAAALQYLAPTILLLFSVLMLRTLGCSDWNSNPVGASRIQYSSFISNSTREAALDLRGVLTPALFRGIMSYMVWWLCTSWLITTVFGVIYLKIFEASWSRPSVVAKNGGNSQNVRCIVEKWNENKAEVDMLRKWQVFLFRSSVGGVTPTDHVTTRELIIINEPLRSFCLWGLTETFP